MVSATINTIRNKRIVVDSKDQFILPLLNSGH